MGDRSDIGDFHIIRMDDLFHVVFRPSADPEWFRIIATFYTYERAYCYCDIERISSYETWDDRGGNSDTLTEAHDGTREPPIQVKVPEGWMGRFDGAPDLVRGVCTEADKAIPIPPDEDFSQHPNEEEEPKSFNDRLFAQALAREADKPTCIECGGPRSPSSGQRCRKCYQKKPLSDEDNKLTDNQEKVLQFFLEHANPMRLVNATWKQVADGSGVLKTNVASFVEALERKGLIEIVERGTAGQSSVFKLVPETIMASAKVPA